MEKLCLLKHELLIANNESRKGGILKRGNYRADVATPPTKRRALDFQ